MARQIPQKKNAISPLTGAFSFPRPKCHKPFKNGHTLEKNGFTESPW